MKYKLYFTYLTPGITVDCEFENFNIDTYKIDMQSNLDKFIILMLYKKKLIHTHNLYI